MDDILSKLEACIARLDQMSAQGISNERLAVDPQRSGVYDSMVKVNGKPTLPPLMTPEKRREMAHYRAVAAERERRRALRKERDMVARVENIVKSYEASRQSFGSKETSPQPVSDHSPHQVLDAVGIEDDSKPSTHDEASNRKTYSPLKYMEKDADEEWNVRPATPWRKSKGSKSRKQIAANFGTATAKRVPISSTLRMDSNERDDSRGYTPDVSAISLASSRAISSMSNVLPVGMQKEDQAPAKASIETEEFRPSSAPGRIADSGLGETGTSIFMSTQMLERIIPDSLLHESRTTHHNSESRKSPESQIEMKDSNVDSAQGEEMEATISRLSPILKDNHIEHKGTTEEVLGVSASLGSQSTSSSSNSALNQTVIDLSQMSLTQAPSGQDIPESFCDGKIKRCSADLDKDDVALPHPEITKTSLRITKPPAEITKVIPESENLEKVQGGLANELPPGMMQHEGNIEQHAIDAVSAAQYLSDTESYLSLLGEYSELPIPGSRRQQVAGTEISCDAKKTPFFADPTLDGKTHVAAETLRGANNGEGVQRETKSNNLFESKEHDIRLQENKENYQDGNPSESSLASSEFLGSSLGTLAQSCTLPISLSMTSESTLQGVDDAWDRTSQDVTPTGTEGCASPLGEVASLVALQPLLGLAKDAGLVRTPPVGQESAISSEIRSPDVDPLKADTMATASPSDGASMQLKEVDQRSGVKVESKFTVETQFQTPRPRHVRSSSYTLDFPSPALLDAEARHEAPHVRSIDLDNNGSANSPEPEQKAHMTNTNNLPAGAKSKGGVVERNVASGVGSQDEEAKTSQLCSEEEQSNVLSLELKDLKLDDLTETKVLNIQLSCLERMQERLKRQHQEQMQELMNQQMQEISLLESEMAGVRRQALESALGHVEDHVDETLDLSSFPISDQNREAATSSKSISQCDEMVNGASVSSDMGQRMSSGNADRTTCPPSPGVRKRRHDGTSTGDNLVVVPPSYIGISSLAGSGQSQTHAILHSPVSGKSLNNSQELANNQHQLNNESLQIHPDSKDSKIQGGGKKLTPQDSLESRASEGLVEVPPSYIATGDYHKPVQRSPPRDYSHSPVSQQNQTTGRPATSPASYGIISNSTSPPHSPSSNRPSTSPATFNSTENPTDMTSFVASADKASVPTVASADVDYLASSSEFNAWMVVKDLSHLSSWAATNGNVSEDLTGLRGMDSFFLSDSQTEDADLRKQIHDMQPAVPDVRPWSISPSLQMDVRYEKLSARVKGYLTRALLRTPKVSAIVKTIRDTRSFLIQFQAETPVKRGHLSAQDTKLAHRVLAQLRAAQYELDDIFHVYPVHKRLAILTAAREQERENFFNKKVSPPSVGANARQLSAATRKAMERRKQHQQQQQTVKEQDQMQSVAKRQKLAPQHQRPKSAIDSRILRPLQSDISPGRPATALPPTSTQQSYNLKKAENVRKPFPAKAVIVSRHTSRASKAGKSPSRLNSRPVSRVVSSRPATGVGSHATRKTTAGQQVRSPGKPTGVQTQAKTKNVRRSLYPASTTSGTARTTTTMQRKQSESRKP